METVEAVRIAKGETGATIGQRQEAVSYLVQHVSAAALPGAASRLIARLIRDGIVAPDGTILQPVSDE